MFPDNPILLEKLVWAKVAEISEAAQKDARYSQRKNLKDRILTMALTVIVLACLLAGWVLTKAGLSTLSRV